MANDMSYFEGRIADLREARDNGDTTSMDYIVRDMVLHYYFFSEEPNRLDNPYITKSDKESLEKDISSCYEDGFTFENNLFASRMLDVIGSRLDDFLMNDVVTNNMFADYDAKYNQLSYMANTFRVAADRYSRNPNDYPITAVAQSTREPLIFGYRSRSSNGRISVFTQLNNPEISYDDLLPFAEEEGVNPSYLSDDFDNLTVDLRTLTPSGFISFVEASNIIEKTSGMAHLVDDLNTNRVDLATFTHEYNTLLDEGRIEELTSRYGTYGLNTNLRFNEYEVAVEVEMPEEIVDLPEEVTDISEPEQEEVSAPVVEETPETAELSEDVPEEETPESSSEEPSGLPFTIDTDPEEPVAPVEETPDIDGNDNPLSAEEQPVFEGADAPVEEPLVSSAEEVAEVNESSEPEGPEETTSEMPPVEEPQEEPSDFNPFVNSVEEEPVEVPVAEPVSSEPDLPEAPIDENYTPEPIDEEPLQYEKVDNAEIEQKIKELDAKESVLEEVDKAQKEREEALNTQEENLKNLANELRTQSEELKSQSEELDNEKSYLTAFGISFKKLLEGYMASGQLTDEAFDGMNELYARVFEKDQTMYDPTLMQPQEGGVEVKTYNVIEADLPETEEPVPVEKPQFDPSEYDVDSVLDSLNSQSLTDYAKLNPRAYLLTNQTFADKLSMVKANGLAIAYMDKTNSVIENAAVKENGLAISFINNPSSKTRRLALEQNFRSIEFMGGLSLNETLYAVNNLKQHPERITEENMISLCKRGQLNGYVCNKLVDFCPEFIQYAPVDVISEKVFTKAVAKNPGLFSYVPESRRTDSLQELAVSMDARNIQFIKDPNVKLVYNAVSQDKELYYSLDDKTKERFIKALDIQKKSLTERENTAPAATGETR